MKYVEKWGNWHAETLIWEAGTQKPSYVHNCIPTHCPTNSPTQHVPKLMRTFTVKLELLWAPTTRHMFTHALSGGCPFSTHRQGNVLNFSDVLWRSSQKAGRVLMAVALSTCCIAASWSSNLPRERGTLVVSPSQREWLIPHLPYPRNNLAIRTWGLLHEHPWKQGYSDTRNARTMRLKGWVEKGILFWLQEGNNESYFSIHTCFWPNVAPGWFPI